MLDGGFTLLVGGACGLGGGGGAAGSADGDDGVACGYAVAPEGGGGDGDVVGATVAQPAITSDANIDAKRAGMFRTFFIGDRRRKRVKLYLMIAPVSSPGSIGTSVASSVAHSVANSVANSLANPLANSVMSSSAPTVAGSELTPVSGHAVNAPLTGSSSASAAASATGATTASGMLNPSFVHLRMHSEYSIVDGMVRIDEAVAAAGADRMPALALTDLGNVFGMVKFYGRRAAGPRQGDHRMRRHDYARF